MLHQTEGETVSFVCSRSQRKNISPGSFQRSSSFPDHYVFGLEFMLENLAVKCFFSNALRSLVSKRVQFEPLDEMIDHD